MTHNHDSGPPPAGMASVPYARFTRRLHALALDALLYLGVIILMVLGAPLFERTPIGQRLFFGSVVLFLLLYEPVLVATRGGTLGHHWANLLVVDSRSGAKLRVPRALLRFLIKSLLGWLSFVTMAFTRRHQAMHDLMTASYVRIADLSMARPEQYAEERQPVAVSVKRRLLTIIAYNVILFVILLGFFGATAGLVSDACWDTGVCTAAEDGYFAAASVAWLILVIVTITLGWRGRLPGARKPVA